MEEKAAEKVAAERAAAERAAAEREEERAEAEERVEDGARARWVEAGWEVVAKVAAARGRAAAENRPSAPRAAPRSAPARAGRPAVGPAAFLLHSCQKFARYKT